VPDARSKVGTRRLSAPDSVIERAVETLHNGFADALSAEWDIQADSAKVRNAMQPLPNRCRQCKKPAAGFGISVCTCKDRVEYERCLSNPRETLLDLFRQRCQSVLRSVSLATFVEQITNIAIANGRDLDWVEGQIRELWPSCSRVCRKWIIDVCPPPFMQTRQLPAWFRDHGVVVDADSHRALSSDDSEAEFRRIEGAVEPYFEEAYKKAVHQASIQIAKVAYPVHERVPRGRARQDLTAAFIARTKRDNPEWSIEQICRHLDAYHLPLHKNYERLGFSTWHDIWKDPKYRNRIKRFISAIEPAAPDRKLQTT
jgi:hypothetical protein